MPDFKLVSDFKPTGDQPEAIAKLVDGLRRGYQHQTLLGATGTGKTYVMAAIVEQLNRPTLVLAHNKTLAAQLYSEFKEFFPHNAVEYFVTTTTINLRHTCRERTRISRRTRRSTTRSIGCDWLLRRHC